MVEEGTEDDQFKAVMDEAKEVSAFSSLCVELQFFFDKFIIATLQKKKLENSFSLHPGCWHQH